MVMAIATAAMTEEPPALSKLTISGSTLAAILNRAASSPADIDGLLFGAAHPTPFPLSDADADPPPSPLFAAAVSSHLTFHSLLSFYDPLGNLRLPIPSSFQPLLGWFVSRRRCPLRPSARDVAVSAALSLTLPPGSPLVFLLVSPSPASSSAHTHEYRAFQYAAAGGSRRMPRLETKSMQVVNIGPGFRPNYGDFVPRSPFPLLSLWDGEEQGTPRTSMERLKRASKEQEELNVCAQGYDVQRLGKMVGAYAPHCVSEMEDLYRSMQTKLETVASAVVNSSSRVRLEVKNFLC